MFTNATKSLYACIMFGREMCGLCIFNHKTARLRLRPIYKKKINKSIGKKNLLKSLQCKINGSGND